MTITRRGLHEEIEIIDAEIDAANKRKAECFDAYRDQLKAEKRTKGEIKSEIDAFKKAERKLRALKKNEAAALEQDALVDEIVAELQRPLGTRIATRTRTTRDENSPEANRSRPQRAHSAEGASSASGDNEPAASHSGEPALEASPTAHPSAGSIHPNPLPLTSRSAGNGADACLPISHPGTPDGIASATISTDDDRYNHIPDYLRRDLVRA
jgi:hypothetical protein